VGERAEVRNAADPQQVRRAARKDERREARRLAAYRLVLGTEAGRFVFWDLIANAGVFESIWHPSAAIHYNSGRQDYGHKIMADLLRADEDAYDLMNREMRALAKSDARETEAAHVSATPGSREKDYDHD